MVMLKIRIRTCAFIATLRRAIVMIKNQGLGRRSGRMTPIVEDRRIDYS